jgi:hypothetical protein
LVLKYKQREPNVRVGANETPVHIQISAVEVVPECKIVGHLRAACAALCSFNEEEHAAVYSK